VAKSSQNVCRGAGGSGIHSDQECNPGTAAARGAKAREVDEAKATCGIPEGEGYPHQPYANSLQEAEWVRSACRRGQRGHPRSLYGLPRRYRREYRPTKYRPTKYRPTKYRPTNSSPSCYREGLRLTHRPPTKRPGLEVNTFQDRV